ncbi:MAG: CHAT domain-containing protein [Chloroflexota bacterium]
MRIFNALAIVYMHLGRFGDAIELYTDAMRSAKQKGDDVYWAKVARNRGNCAIRQYESVQSGHFGQAQLNKYCQPIEKAIEIFKDVHEEVEEAQCWNELGIYHKALNQWVLAYACYKRTLTIYKRLNHQHGIAGCLNNIGEVLAAQERYAESQQLFRESIQLFDKLDDQYEMADALTNLGKVLSIQKKNSQATLAFEQAIECVESIRGNLGLEPTRTDFFATQTHIYGSQIAYCLQQEDLEKAFDYSERARARGILDRMAATEVYVPTSIPQPLQEQEQILRQNLQDGIASDSDRQKTLEQELDAFYQELQLLEPEYTSLRQANPATTAQVLAQLPSDTVIVSYFALDDQWFGFVLSQANGLSVVELPIQVAQLSAASFGKDGRPRSIIPGSDRLLPKPWLLERLFDSLIEPLFDLCLHFKRLVLIPHGPLHDLPLHAAYDKSSGRYLSEMFDILYAPSVTIQCVHLQQKQQMPHQSGALTLVCGTGRLTHVEHEAHSIAAMTGGQSLMGKEATTDALLKNASRFRYLHFAGHAHFRKDTPMLSGVDLADKRLTAWDLLQMPGLGCSLVTINGCNSGVNHIQPGDELLGLQRALLYSIAPSVLLTLWPIEDLAARLFAHCFYENLLNRSEATEPETLSNRYSHILRKAIHQFRQMTMDDTNQILRADGYEHIEIAEMFERLPQPISVSNGANTSKMPFNHPYYWAGYVLIGEVWPSKVRQSEV